MLRSATYPATIESISEWLNGHSKEWDDGTAFRFAVEFQYELIGCTDIDEILNGRGDLGYWFARSAWGKGFATEAARAVVEFAFETLGLDGLSSGHASDNPASGRVLEKIGFRRVKEVTLWSNPRSMEIKQVAYVLDR
jgi:RimJ/RimL family protein N-acetyltransferase